jgi:hypothetical protein
MWKPCRSAIFFGDADAVLQQEPENFYSTRFRGRSSTGAVFHRGPELRRRHKWLDKSIEGTSCEALA